MRKIPLGLLLIPTVLVLLQSAAAPVYAVNRPTHSRAPATAGTLARKPERFIKAELLSSKGDLGDKTPAQLSQMLKGFKTLIENEQNPEKKAKLSLSEAGTYLALARNYRQKNRAQKTSSAEREASRKVITSLQTLVSAAGLSPTTRAKAAYYVGLAYLNLGEEDETAASFKTALEIEPQAAGAPSLALYLAEQFFEKAQYQGALDMLQSHYERFSESQKALSLYKSAWCYVNMNNTSGAEANFVALVGKDTPFSEDALKDLAYIQSLNRSEDDIIRYAEEKFKGQAQLQATFLSQVYIYSQSQSSTKTKSALLGQVLKSEKDPGKRLKLMLSSFHSAQKDYASQAAYGEFQNIAAELKRNEFRRDTENSKVIADLEIEVFALARAYLDTRNGKLKSPENISTAEVSERLIEILEFHLKVYPKSRDRDASQLILVQAYISRAQFEDAVRLARDFAHAKAPQRASLEHLWSVAVAAAGGSAANKIADAKSREYIFGVLALCQPQEVIAGFSKKAPTSDSEKRLLLLALKIAQRTGEPRLDAQQKNWLKALYTENTQSDSVTNSEKNLARIQFPTASTPKAQFESQAQAAALAVRSSRTSVVRDLEGKSQNRQVQLLTLAKGHEEKVAKMLVEAPLPQGLDPSQVVEYKKGIAELALEFSKQALEYGKIRSGLAKADGSRSVASLTFPTDVQWPLPSGELGETLRGLIAKRQCAGALMMLDQRRTDGSLEGETFFQARSKVLFSLPANPALAAYLAGELSELGQKKLLNRWEDLVATKEKK